MLVTVSIALNDATPENGCFKVIPQSHKWGLQSWGHIARKQDESLTDHEELDFSEQIDVPLSAGSALFFHSPHGARFRTESVAEPKEHRALRILLTASPLCATQRDAGAEVFSSCCWA